MRSGNAWIGVSAQRAGVNGPPLMPGFSQPLDASGIPLATARSTSPTTTLSYGIFTAAARLARDGRAHRRVTRRRPDRVGRRRSRPIGWSPTSTGSMPLEHAVDGFLVHGRVGTTCPPLAAGVASPDPARLPHRPRRAGPRARVGVRHPAHRGRHANPTTAALPAVGAGGLDAPGRVRRAHVERPVRARPRSTSSPGATAR